MKEYDKLNVLIPITGYYQDLQLLREYDKLTILINKI